MSWYTNHRKSSKYLVPDNTNIAPTTQPTRFIDEPLNSTVETVFDASFSEFDAAFRQVDRTLDKLNATATSDSDDGTASVTSEKSYHFGGKQAGHDSSDSENDDGSTTTPHLDATFIDVPETIPLPKSVEIQMFKLMKRVVQLEKTNKKKTLAIEKSVAKIKTLHEELHKVQQEMFEVEAMNGVHQQGGNENITLLKDGNQGNMKKEQERLKRQKERDQNRRKMLSIFGDDNGGGGGEDDIDFDLTNPMGQLKRILNKLQRCCRQKIPFKADLKMIESRFGSSTASFFFFFRWLFLTNLVIFVVQSIFLGIHISVLLSRGHANSSALLPNATDLKSTWVLPQHIQWTMLEGGIPQVFSFSSYTPYDSKDGANDVNMPLLYSSVLFLTQLILLGFTIQKWVYENAKNKQVEAFEGTSSKRWSKFIFTAFDHSIVGRVQHLDQKQLTTETIDVMYIEDQNSATALGRTRLEWVCLYTRRVVVGVLYVCIQFSGWYAIVYLTVDGDVFKSWLMAQLNVQDLFLDPAAVSVSVINALNNKICKVLVAQCKFDDQGNQIKVLVSFLFVSRTFNVGIQLAAYAQLINVFMFLRTGAVFFGIPGTFYRKTAKLFDADGFSCRSNQFGNQFFALLVTDFIISKLLGVLMPLVKFLVAKCRRKKFTKSSFDISNKLVALLFFQQLTLISIPLLPISAVFSLIFLVLNFKFDVWVLLLTQKKPKKPWAAKDAGGFFLKLHVISLVLVTMAVHTLMSLTVLPKVCTLQQQTLPTTKELSILHEMHVDQYQTQTFLSPQDCVLKNTSLAVLGALPMNFTTSTLCACQHACGPWMQSINGYSPILNFLSQEVVPTTVYELINSVQLWVGLATVLMVGRWNLMNTISVDQAIRAETKVVTKQMSDLQMKEIGRLKRKLAMQRQINRDTDGGGEGGSKEEGGKEGREEGR